MPHDSSKKSQRHQAPLAPVFHFPKSFLCPTWPQVFSRTFQRHQGMLCKIRCRWGVYFPKHFLCTRRAQDSPRTSHGVPMRSPWKESHWDPRDSWWSHVIPWGPNFGIDVLLLGNSQICFLRTTNTSATFTPFQKQIFLKLGVPFCYSFDVMGIHHKNFLQTTAWYIITNAI